MRFGSDQAPCPNWPIPSPHGSRPRTPRPEGNWATSFFPVWSHSSITVSDLSVARPPSCKLTLFAMTVSSSSRTNRRRYYAALRYGLFLRPAMAPLHLSESRADNETLHQASER